MNSTKKILIIAPSWVGDIVMTQALLRLLKERDPNCIVDVIARPFLHPLLLRMPEVNRCIASPFTHGKLSLLARFRMGRELRQASYTHAYVITNSFKSALVPFFAKIPVRIGYRGEERYIILTDLRKLDKKRLVKEVERFAALGCEKNESLPNSMLLPKLFVSPESLRVALERFNIPLPTRPILAICPGSEHRKKCWPPSHFAAIAKAKKEEGWDIWIFGGQRERELAEIINAQSNNSCFDLTGKTDLGEAVDLLSLATVVVANDSGLMHAAAALNKPIVAIYGPTPPEKAPPLTPNKFKILTLNLSCSPCKGDCSLEYNKCMHDIGPPMVLQAITAVQN